MMQHVTILGYSFENYPISTTRFNDVPGIYVIHAPVGVLDVGITDKLGERISAHERKQSWLQYANWQMINLAFLYEADKTRRLAIEASLRATLNPFCGEV